MGEHCELMAKEWRSRGESKTRSRIGTHERGEGVGGRIFRRSRRGAFRPQRDNNVRPIPRSTSSRSCQPSTTAARRHVNGRQQHAAYRRRRGVLLGSEDWARERSLPVLAYLTHARTAAVDHAGLAGPREGLLMAHTYAVARLLERTGLRLQDFDFYEIHEAFSAEVLCTLKAWESEDYCVRSLSSRARLALHRQQAQRQRRQRRDRPSVCGHGRAPRRHAHETAREKGRAAAW